MTLRQQVKKLTRTVQRLEAEISIMKGTTVKPKRNPSLKRDAYKRQLKIN